MFTFKELCIPLRIRDITRESVAGRCTPGEMGPAGTNPAPERLHFDAETIVACGACTGCSFCSNCSACSACTGCTGCSSCSGCTTCSGCSACSGCTGCSHCSTCSPCSVSYRYELLPHQELDLNVLHYELENLLEAEGR